MISLLAKIKRICETTNAVLAGRQKPETEKQKPMKAILSVLLGAVLALAMMPGCATDGSHAAKQGAECVIKDGKLLDASGSPMTGCVMMHNGKMMVMNGKLVRIKKNMTMPDGTLCMVNGTCVMKGGAKRQLQEGEVLTPKGDIFHAKGLATPGAYSS